MRPRYAMFGGRLSLSGGACDLLDKVSEVSLHVSVNRST